MDLNVGTIYSVLRLNTKQFDAALASSQTRVHNFAKSIGRMGSYLSLRATLPIVYFGRRTVKSFAAFEDAIQRSAAVTRGMTKVMRDEMEKTALQISKQSLLSAIDLAEGYFALGQAGYSAAQSIKALPVVEEFAIASTIDLDTAIRYLSRTVEGLGMASEDPVKMMEAMTKTSDAFTFAAITTTAEIQDFAVAMTHAAAPALKLVNKGVEEGVSVLMAFARAGIVAEEAGTLLWTTVRDLQRANIKARSEWERIGVSVYDANRNMRNLADIFSDLEDRFANMSDEGKKVSLMLLGFQDRSLRGIQALMGFSDEMKIFQREMAKGGDLTKKVAETYMKSFRANLIMARNAIQVFSISLGRLLAPFIIKFNVQLQRFIRWWENLAEGTKLVYIEIVALIAIAGPLLILLSKLTMTVTYLSIAFNTCGWATLKLIGALGTVGIAALAVVTAVVAAAAAAYTLRAAWIQGVDTIRNRLIALGQFFKENFEYFGAVIKEFLVWISENWDETFRWMTQRTSDFAKDFGGMWEAVKRLFTGWDKGIGVTAEDLAQAFTKGFEQAEVELDAMKAHIVDFVVTTKPYIAAFGEATKEHILELGNALKAQFGADIETIKKLVTEKIKALNEELLGLMPTKEQEELLGALEKIKKSVKEFEEERFSLNVWGQHLRHAGTLVERLRDVAVNAFEEIADSLTELAMTGTTDIKQLTKVILEDLLRAIIRAQMAAMWTDVLGPAVSTAKWDFLRFIGYKPGGGGGATFASATATPGAGRLAKGAAILGGQIIPMAAGHIVSAASLVPISRNRSALIGERGPEAVMPLTRDTQGRLGVRSEQPKVEVDSRTKIVNVFDPEEALAAMQSERGEKVILNVLRRKGII